MGVADKKFFSKNDGSFLLSANLSESDAQLSRKKRARLHKVSEKKQEETELQAEKRPRGQSQWAEQYRKDLKLPTVDGSHEAEELVAHVAKNRPGTDGTLGKKRAKRLARLEAKQAKKASKKLVAEAKTTRESADALKSKVQKNTGPSKPALELLSKHVGRGPAAEQHLLAMAAEKITAEPEKELALFDVFFELHRSSSDPRTRQLALLSAIAVFRDLVPGYRIREPSEAEKAIIRSKQVMSLERYELTLLQTYRRLLPDMEAAMKREPSATAPALAALVKSAFDFNFRQRLIQTAVRHANSRLDNVCKVLVEGLKEMVEIDRRLEASRELVLAVGRLAQGAAVNAGKGAANEGGQGRLRHELLQVLLQLQVGRADEVALKGDLGDVPAADDELRRGLAEASINQTVEHLRKAEAELLYEVFVVYLRILRQRHVHGREMLGIVLTGLSRWGQQVNLELLLEIITELRYAVQDATAQGDGVVALHGLNCALVLLSGPSRALLLDVSWLADAMTGALLLTLPSLHSTHSETAEWPPAACFSFEEGRLQASERELLATLELASTPSLVLRCLDAALKCPQGYGRASDAALAVLIEHLFLLSLSADPHVGLPLLQEASQLLRRHHRLHTLLDVEGGIFGLGGVADRTVSVVWQFQPLAFSLAPDMARAGRELPTLIPQRTASLMDIFPGCPARSWLAAEFVRHACATAFAPKPQGKPRHSTAHFLSEAELKAQFAARRGR